jgi:hypothetical protein
MTTVSAAKCAVAALACAIALDASAALIHWRLSGVAFEDGTMAQGTSTYDDVGDTVVSWNISVLRGEVLLPFAYMPGDSIALYAPYNSVYGSYAAVVFSSVEAGHPHPGGVQERQLRLTSTSLFSAAGPIVPLDLGATSVSSMLECLNCGSVRVIVGGSLERVALTPPVALVEAIEFYHAGFDHYFLSADPPEIAGLDSGFFTGWARTGERFFVHAPGSYDASPVHPVCRYYGLPSAGLDSHFYSASPAECYRVNRDYGGQWQAEGGNVFQVILPNELTGACPLDTVPVYRVFNRRADANHRYTTSTTIRAQMEALGWIREGYGPDATIMCAFAPPAT